MDSLEFSVAPERVVQPLKIEFGSIRSLMDESDRQFSDIAVQISPAFSRGCIPFRGYLSSTK